MEPWHHLSRAESPAGMDAPAFFLPLVVQGPCSPNPMPPAPPLPCKNFPIFPGLKKKKKIRNDLNKLQPIQCLCFFSLSIHRFPPPSSITKQSSSPHGAHHLLDISRAAGNKLMPVLPLSGGKHLPAALEHRQEFIPPPTNHQSNISSLGCTFSFTKGFTRAETLGEF